jgi:hypothetical protein
MGGRGHAQVGEGTHGREGAQTADVGACTIGKGRARVRRGRARVWKGHERLFGGTHGWGWGRTSIGRAHTGGDGGAHDGSLCQFQGGTLWVESTLPKVS